MSENVSRYNYHLNEIYTFASGLSKSRDEFGFGFPFLSFKEVFHNTFLPDKLENLANTTEKERNSCSIKRGDVFLTRTSETQEELGMSSVALIDYPNATFNGFTKRLRPIGNLEVWPEYTGYYFRSPHFRATVTSMSSMTTRASLNNEMMSALKITIPPLPEQKAIASVLRSLDNKIDLLHRQNLTLEAMADTLFRQRFTEEAQEAWANGCINDLAYVLSGYAFKSSSFSDLGQYRLITIKAVQDGYIELNNADYIHELPVKLPEYCKLSLGDILLSLTGNVGRCCLVDTNDLLLNQRVAKLQPNSSRDWAFVYVLFRQKSMKAILEELAKGTAQANLSPIETGKLEIKIPPEQVLQSFSDEASPLVKKVLSNKYQIQTLEKLRDTLLPKLMSGEVKVIS